MYIWQLFFGKNPLLSKNELLECTDLDYFIGISSYILLSFLNICTRSFQFLLSSIFFFYEFTSRHAFFVHFIVCSLQISLYFVDFCSKSQSLEECLKPYFHSSHENDVFVFNYAVVYALISKCNPSFNMNSIVSVDAIIDFFRLIDSIFKGKVKIWVTTPHPRGHEGEKLYGVMNNIDMKVYEAMILYRWMYRNKVTLTNPSSEWVHTFIYIYSYIYICVYIHTYNYIDTYIHKYIHMITYFSTQTYVYVCVDIFVLFAPLFI